MTGTRPNALSQLFHDRGIRFAAKMAVVVAIPVAVLFYFQFRSLNALEATSAVVLRQLSSDTAESLVKYTEQYLKRPQRNVLLRVPQVRLEPLDLAWIDPVFEEGLRESPFLDSIYTWSEIGPPEDINRWWKFGRSNLRQPAGSPGRRFVADPAVGERMLARLYEIAQLRQAIVAFTDQIDGRAYYVQAQLRFKSSARDRMTSVVAFVVDIEQLRTEFLPEFFRTRLDAVQQPTGFAQLQTQVADEHGASIFISGGTPTGTFVDERSFPLIFFDKDLLEFAAPYEEHREIWNLRTGYGPQTIPALVSVSTRPQRALMVVLATVMGVGVFFIAGAAAREVRIAELKSNFVASVSHDLKTPLALIQLFAETLELGRVKSTDRAQEYYRIINGEAKKLTRLIENLLDFSRMEAGLRPYRVEPADVGALVRQMLGEMDNQLSQGHFTVTTDIDADLPPVMADANAVKQAVENLLTNAMKYSGDARQIEVVVVERGGHIVVDVTDHGIGIPRKELRRIFRKFYRVQSDLGGGPQGCGLGLAIVDHTMRGHGGFVRVASEPQHGSTFTLHFPIPAQPAFDGVPHEAHSGDRGRAANAARPA